MHYLNHNCIKFQTTNKLISIGNDILTSVLSLQEGPGLDRMVSGVMERYRQAAVTPPVLLYMDCGCCVSEGTNCRLDFSEWPQLHVRMDIWHCLHHRCSTPPSWAACLHAALSAMQGTLLCCGRWQGSSSGRRVCQPLRMFWWTGAQPVLPQKDVRRGDHHQPYWAWSTFGLCRNAT